MTTQPNPDERQLPFLRVVIALVLFGIAFGYIEAAVVVYLRAIYDPMRHRIRPDQPEGELFPLLQVEQLRAEGPEHVRRLGTELGREAATLVLLAAVALAVARNVIQWLAAFVLIFGVWDIFYYVFLKVILDWPASLTTWDILFLLPVPWVGPVLSPVIVAVTMIVCGLVALQREWSGRPLAFRWFHWAGLLASGLVIVIAFCWDFRNTVAGGMPNPFNWRLFALGEIVALVAFAHATWAKGPTPTA